MRYCLALVTVMLILFAPPLLDAGSPRSTPEEQLRKSLPLDASPDVVLKTRENSQYLNDRIVVKLMPQLDASAIAPAMKALSAYSMTPMFPPQMTQHQKGDVDLSRFYVITYLSPVDAFSAAEEFSKLPAVQYAEPWFVYPVDEHPMFDPNDSLYTRQWGLSQIQAASAWNVSKGDTSIVIGIVDTGVELNHPDLAANIWHNRGEMGLDALGRDKRTNAIDDDNNGFIDDWQGWDFGGADFSKIVADNNPVPTGANNAHGTHVAGIASAVTNNGTGVAGTGFQCRILAVKTSADNDTRAPGGLAYILSGSQGIAYAAFMGAAVVNCSWGGSGGSQTEQDIINYATQQGTLVVAAAGNDNSGGGHYPSGYDNVLSVAATSSSDQKATFSNYGMTVDVSAPGVSILSTVYPSTYTNYNGTSMAAPFAAGVAGLVKTVHPGFSPLQLGERVRVTSDNIDAANPAYVYALGKGRINASRAVTENPPAVRVRDLIVRDSTGGNNNGVPDPNEIVDVYMTFVNYLTQTSNAVATLSTTNPYLSIVNGAFSLGALTTLGTVRNTNVPFRVRVNSNAPPGHVASLTLTINDGAYNDYQVFTVIINPTFRTHDVGNLRATMTNNGRVGFNDYADNKQGVGFVYPAGGVNHLFEGGIIIGTSASKVVDNVRITSQASQDNDFRAPGPFQLQTPGRVSNQDGYTWFSDSTAPSANRLGVRVDEYTYAYADSVDDDFVIVRYDLRNLGSTELTNLYFGIFTDWDIGNPSANRSAFDTTRALFYSWEVSPSASPFLGVRALDGAASVRALTNGPSLALERADKWAFISGGTAQSAAGPGDMLSVISSGPFTIAPGATRKLGFAFIGGATLSALQSNADAAHAKWKLILTGIDGKIRDGGLASIFDLAQNFPNPFNPSTTIQFSVPHGLGTTHATSLRVFDVLGRQVAVLLNEQMEPGTVTVNFDASQLSSGVYFYRLQSGSFAQTKTMLLIR